MHVHLKHAGAALLLAAGGSIFSVTGCANDDSSMFLAGCLQVARDTCTATATATATFQLEGTIAGGLGAPYECFAQVENQLVPTGNAMTLMTETGRVILQSADIKVLDSTGAVYTRAKVSPGPAEFTVPITGFIDVGDGTNPGLGVAEVTFIDSDTVKDLGLLAAQKGAQQVQVQALLHGQSLGGESIETQKYFLFPIVVEAGSQCYDPPGEMCSGGTDKPDADCIIGQDELNGVDCRLLSADPALACATLECTPPATGTGSLAGAHCPAVPGVVDGSCCM
jgi:hypothetical protein